MYSTIRSLFVVGVLFAGVTGCAAADDRDDETPEESAANTQQQNEEEASQAKIDESTLALMKKRHIDTLGRKESGLPKK